MTVHDSARDARPADARDPDAYVERFAAAMVASGMPRMAARVFALLLTRDDGAGTAADIGSALQRQPGGGLRGGALPDPGAPGHPLPPAGGPA